MPPPYHPLARRSPASVSTNAASSRSARMVRSERRTVTASRISRRASSNRRGRHFVFGRCLEIGNTTLAIFQRCHLAFDTSVILGLLKNEGTQFIQAHVLRFDQVEPKSDGL